MTDTAAIPRRTPWSWAWRSVVALVLLVVFAGLGYDVLLFSSLMQELGWQDKLIGAGITLALLVLCGYCLWKICVLLRKQRVAGPAPSRRKWLVVEIIVVLAAAACLYPVGDVLLFPLVMLTLKHGAGKFDRPRMEQILTQVRAQEFRGSRQFLVDAAGKVIPLAENDYNLRGMQLLQAERGDDGALDFTLTTVDNGHAGAYGFAYSDKLLKPVVYLQGDNPTLEINSSLREVETDGRIDDHWWRVFNSD